MQGLKEKTEKIFEEISKLSCIKDYALIGGTAISLQIGKRLSEDLDFCKWSKNLRKDKPTVDWPQIQKQLETIGKVNKVNVLGFDQVDFVVNDVKITFLTLPKRLSPVDNLVPIINNIKAADLASLGVMKVELSLSRSEWRDYYDIYSLLREGQSLKAMIDGAGKYSNHVLKTRDALSFLSNGSNYKKGKDFNLLKPFYDVDSKTIEELVKSKITKEYKMFLQ
ncbi:MAG TPA: nucleotidyl transferase AbiEii/AbiGii toxin family protein [Bacteroidales bacterium]|nr:nucleotidyl transferase AbiEii/AbiGii toxin family protein [Bacteroidales bacterium]